MEKIIERVKSILLSPKDALTAVKSEDFTVMDFMKEYVAIVAAIPAVSSLVGRIFSKWNLFESLVFSVFIYISGLVIVFIVGKIIDALAISFGATKDDLNSFKLSAFIFTPVFISGLFLLFPAFSPFFLLGSLYGVWILYLGLPVLMAVAEDKNIGYMAATAISGIVVMAIFYQIAARLAFGY